MGLLGPGLRSLGVLLAANATWALVRRWIAAEKLAFGAEPVTVWLGQREWPAGKIIESAKAFGDMEDFVHMHIPKAAGESFHRDMLLHVPPGPYKERMEGGTNSAELSYYSSRHCTCRYPKSPNTTCSGFVCDCSQQPLGKGRKVLTIVREPMHHLLSIYTWCKTAPEMFNTNRRFELTFPTFRMWLRRYLETKSSQDYFVLHKLCHDPRNIQTTRFSTRPDPGPEHCGPQGPNANWSTEVAIRNMQDTDFVGIMEAYHESLCLLHVKAFGELPMYCDCRDRGAWDLYYHVAPSSHGTAFHRLEDESPETLRLGQELTRDDQKLYAAAVQRFVGEIRDVERLFETQILCWNLTVPDYR